MKTQKRKKSLTGWTNKDWYKHFTKSHEHWGDRVFSGAVMNKKVTAFADKKVRVTIEEIV